MNLSSCTRFSLLLAILTLVGCSEMPQRHLDSRLGSELLVPSDLSRPQYGPMAEPALKAPKADLKREQITSLMVPPVIEQTYVAQPIGTATEAKSSRVSRAELAGNDGLWLEEPYGRGWRLLGSALNQIGVLIEDRDRSRGLYYIQVAIDRENNAFLAYFGAEDEIERLPMQARLSQQGERGRIELRPADAADVKVAAQLTDGLLERLLEKLR